MVILLFFHNSIKIRISTNLIKVLKDEEGNSIQDMQKIKDMATVFYQNLLGSSSHEFSQAKAERGASLIKRKFSDSCIAVMGAEVTRAEIHKVLFSMNQNKAPGPNGFSVVFFQKAWPIIGDDVCEAILEFCHSLIPQYCWDYILYCLKCFGAPARYVSWIKECITSPSFTIVLNGTLVGYFHGRKGLRQGDPFLLTSLF
jgi:hypothetical protein